MLLILGVRHLHGASVCNVPIWYQAPSLLAFTMTAAMVTLVAPHRLQPEFPCELNVS